MLGKEIVWYVFCFLFHANCLYCILRMIFFSKEWSWKKVSWKSAHRPIWKLSILCTTNILGNSADKGITATQDCGFCAFQRTWSCQPFISSIPAGNLELSCALLFSGSLPSKATRMFQFLNMASISYRTFMYHQQCYLHPVVIGVWRDQQASHMQEAQSSGRHVHLGGERRADTPDHCAKFGSYTLMDLKKKIVVDLQLIQVKNNERIAL